LLKAIYTTSLSLYFIVAVNVLFLMIPIFASNPTYKISLFNIAVIGALSAMRPFLSVRAVLYHSGFEKSILIKKVSIDCEVL